MKDGNVHNTESKHKVEVFILTKNREKGLQCMLDSLIECSAEFSMATIIDNGNCNTALLDKYKQYYRINYRKNSSDIGFFGSMDHALVLASRKYFVIYHDDDIAVPGALSIQAEYLDSNPDVALVATSIEIFNELNEVVPRDEALYKEGIVKFSKRALITDFLKNGFFLPFPTIMYRASIFPETNFQVMSFFSGPCTDVLVWMKINCDYEVSYISDKLYRYFKPTPKGSVYENNFNGEYLVHQYDLLVGMQKNLDLKKGELKLLRRKARSITRANIRIIGDYESLWSDFRSRILVNPIYRKLLLTISILSCYRNFPTYILVIVRSIRKMRLLWAKMKSLVST